MTEHETDGIPGQPVVTVSEPPRPPGQAPDRNLAMELVRVTGLGDPDEFHGEVAVGGLSRGPWWLAYRDHGLAWDAVGFVLCHGRRLPSGSNRSERRPGLARPRIVRRRRGEPRPGAFEPL